MSIIGWFDVTATAAPELRDFYAHTFGWTVQVDGGMDYGLISTQPSAAPAGGIGQAGQGNRHRPGVVAYVSVDDVEAVLARATGRGASVVVEPWEVPGLGRMAVIADPEDNRVGLISPPPT